MKKNIVVNITDLRNLIKDKQNEMRSIVRNKYKGYEKMVIRAVSGGIYVGLLGKGSRKLQEEYKTDNVVGLMDYNLLKTYYETTCEVVQLLKNNHYAIYEYGADEEIYNIVKSRAFKQKDKFKKDNKLSPKNYLNDLVRKMKKPVEEGIVELDTDKYSVIDKALKFNLEYFKSQKLNSDDLDAFRDKLKKEIQTLMIKRYDNEKGYGEITGKIYRNFYDFSAEDIKVILKEQGIKAKSISSILDDNHKLYIAAILKTYLDYSVQENNEHQLRIITSLLSNVARDEFIKENNATPLHNLIIVNKYEEEIKNIETKQPSLFDNHAIEPQVRVRKKSVKDLVMEKEEEYMG